MMLAVDLLRVGLIALVILAALAVLVWIIQAIR